MPTLLPAVGVVAGWLAGGELGAGAGPVQRIMPRGRPRSALAVQAKQQMVEDDGVVALACVVHQRYRQRREAPVRAEFLSQVNALQAAG